ncbi:MAG: hypothetical protein IPJ98_27115 [Bryobacterales bacterium]|nr:hypothetical protein [Bryobacterales bacterium]
MAAHSPLPSPASRPSHRISLDLYDPEVVHDILQRPDGPARDEYLRLALRIGVLALRLAGGQVDEKKLREEGDRLVQNVQREIEDYLHPERGRLRASLSSFVEGDRSVLAQTIAAKLGESSPIFKLLDPRNAEGLHHQLTLAVRDIVDAHARGITGQLSLDSPDSALSRLKRTLDERVGEIQKHQTDFQAEVRESLATLQATRRANERGTVHGLEFEAALAGEVSRLAQGHADIAEPTGNSTGLIKNCKTGDVVVTLGPESPAPGVRIVWEAKQAGGYSLRHALDEINEARKTAKPKSASSSFLRATPPSASNPSPATTATSSSSGTLKTPPPPSSSAPPTPSPAPSPSANPAPRPTPPPPSAPSTKPPAPSKSRPATSTTSAPGRPPSRPTEKKLPNEPKLWWPTSKRPSPPSTPN